jgi:hypothetical protein
MNMYEDSNTTIVKCQQAKPLQEINLNNNDKKRVRTSSNSSSSNNSDEGGSSGCNSPMPLTESKATNPGQQDGSESDEGNVHSK